MYAQRLAQHVHTSLPMSMEICTEARSIVDNTPGEDGLAVWRRWVQRFDPVSGQEGVYGMDGEEGEETGVDATGFGRPRAMFG